MSIGTNKRYIYQIKIAYNFIVILEINFESNFVLFLSHYLPENKVIYCAQEEEEHTSN